MRLFEKIMDPVKIDNFESIVLSLRNESHDLEGRGK
jgi:hypothetical protein